MVAIRVEGLKKSFVHTESGNEVVAISQLDFEITSGQLVAIAGRTGCGKSTFLNLLLGLDRPSAGRILVDGRSPYDDFYWFRGKIAGIFQQDRLLPWRTALDNVELGLVILGRPAAERRELAASWLARMGLGEYLGAYPHEMSGGMRQRVAMARAYAVDPEILVVDEAFGHLDEITARALRKTFDEVTRGEHKTAVMVTHQLDEAFEIADRILVFGRPATLLVDVVNPELSRDSRRWRACIHDAIETNRAVADASALELRAIPCRRPDA
jgi:NitT/TauT family transport system ATP-binding protein